MQTFYYRDKEGREIGPFDLTTLAKFRAAGVLDGGTLVRASETTEWKPCRELIAETPLSAAKTVTPAAPASGTATGTRNKALIFCLAALLVVGLVWYTSFSPPARTASTADSKPSTPEPVKSIKAELEKRINPVRSLRLGMEYKASLPSELNSSAFAASIYIFSDKGLSVYDEVSAKGDICRKVSDGSLLSSADRWDIRVGAARGASLIKGTDEETRMEVLFGPGDWMPVLENAPYKLEGDSIWVDWSQGHSSYFQLTHANSGAEVFTIKNDGLILESSTSPGFILTLNLNASPAQIAQATSAKPQVAEVPGQTPLASPAPAKADQEVLEALAEPEREYSIGLSPLPSSGELASVFHSGGITRIRFVDSDIPRGTIKALIKENIYVPSQTNLLALTGEINGGRLAFRSASSAEPLLVLALHQSYRSVTGQFKSGTSSGTVSLNLGDSYLLDADPKIADSLMWIKFRGRDAFKSAVFTNNIYHFPTESPLRDSRYVYVPALVMPLKSFPKDQRILLFQKPLPSLRVVPIFCLDQVVRKIAPEELEKRLKEQTGKSVVELIREDSVAWDKATSAAWAEFDQARSETAHGRQAIDFELRGIKLGDTLAAIRGKLPNLQAGQNTNSTSADDPEMEGHWALTREQGLPDAKFVAVELHGGRVFRMRITYSTEDLAAQGGWRGILNNLKDKFGEPNPDSRGLQEKDGETRATYQWTFPEVFRSFTFGSYTGTKGYVSIMAENTGFSGGEPAIRSVLQGGKALKRQPSGFFEEVSPASHGNAVGLSYLNTAKGAGAVFSRAEASRLEYSFADGFPTQGTLEWRVLVNNGYSYDKGALSASNSEALIFTTAGPDTWYPGSAWLRVRQDGVVTFAMADSVGGKTPLRSLVANKTGFTFGEWHTVGISFGADGRSINVDGHLVAQDNLSLALAAGGTPSAQICAPSIGEMNSRVWPRHQYDSGFDGMLDSFRASNKQADWKLCK